MSNSYIQCADGPVEGVHRGSFRKAMISVTEIWQLPRIWSARAQQRRDLANLTAHELADIGVKREDALFESRKPFWQA